MFKPEVHQGGGQKAEAPVNELRGLLNEYSCGLDLKPEMLVYGRDIDGAYGVLHWIKPCQEQELTAKKISNLINGQGGDTKIMTIEEYEKSAADISGDVIDNVGQRG